MLFFNFTPIAIGINLLQIKSTLKRFRSMCLHPAGRRASSASPFWQKRRRCPAAMARTTSLCVSRTLASRASSWTSWTRPTLPLPRGAKPASTSTRFLLSRSTRSVRLAVSPSTAAWSAIWSPPSSQICQLIRHHPFRRESLWKQVLSLLARYLLLLFTCENNNLFLCCFLFK